MRLNNSELETLTVIVCAMSPFFALCAYALYLNIKNFFNDKKTY